MAIQFPDFQRITFDEANPMLVGMERGQKLSQSAMMFPQDLKAKMLANQIAQAQAKYAEPMAKEGLTKAQQENQWNPKIWQSEIGLRGAQAGLAGKQTQWYDQEAGAKIAFQKAEAQKSQIEAQQNKMKMDYLKGYLGGTSNMTPVNSPMGIEGTGTSSATPGVSYGTGQPQSQAPATVQPSNAVYGIETPKPTREDIANKMFFNIDTFTPKMENAKKQQQSQYDSYQKTIADSIVEANTATKAKQLLATFNRAMDESTYKGPRWGNLPSSGLAASLVPGNLSPEQEADRAANQLLPGAIAELRDAMKNGQFSNLDMNNSSRMKVDRTMTDETRDTQSKWLTGVWDRMEEKGKFYTVMGNPKSQAEKTQADAAWAAYQREFPLISADGKTYQGENLRNWPLFTTPKALDSIRRTGTYKPTAAEKKTYMMKYPDGQGGFVMLPVKKGKVEDAFRKGATPL